MRVGFLPGAVSALVTGLVLAPLAAGPAGAVPTDQSYPVPDSGVYRVEGHGYGHGHGMSQYGAQGAALQGLSHRQILRFYYPGTRLETSKGRIRVLLTADTSPDLVVEARSGLLLHDLGDGTSYRLPTGRGATRWRLRVDRDGRDVVGWYDGEWHRWRPGGEPALTGEGEFRAGGRPITLRVPGGTAKYRGRLRATAPEEGSTHRVTVNVLGLTSYVQGVVPAEMPASWEPEAVQAQAVAARTYGVRSRSDNRGDPFHICDTTSCQVYRGVAGEDPRGNDAAVATAGEVLTYEGEPAFTQFSASSGGWTAEGSMPYLPAKRDPYDDWAGNYVHDWSVRLSARSIRDAYPALGRLRRIQVTSRDGNGEWQGRVWRMVLHGSRGDVRLSGDDFRFRFGLRSTWFSF